MQCEVLKVPVGGWLRTACVLLGLVLASPPSHAQRQMENLGRGVVAVRSGNNTAYVGWRLLATDPDDIAFNVYRSQNGATPVKLNASPISSSTDFVDTTAALSVSNAWFVRPVLNGIEQASSAAFGFPGNSIVPLDFQNKSGPYVRIPLAVIPNGNHYTHHCWPGDLDGDGEFDFVATRIPNSGGVSYVDAYLRNGKFLWRMNMGVNSTDTGDFPPSGVSVGHSDNVTVFDLDGDGRAEVLVRTARGVTVTNSAGAQVASIPGPNDVTQYVSVIDGLTGVEKARMILPNPVPSAGAMSSHFGIMFADGVRPSLVIESINRSANGAFNLSITCWDYRDAQLKMRWLWTPPNDGHNYSRAHQFRVADIDHDGRDEFCEIAFALRDAGDHAEAVFSNELLHGDRFHIADLDPHRPGLETFAIQQDNPNLLANALHDSATGTMIKKWYAAGVVDVGRGNAGDVDLNTRGVEVFSTMPGLWTAKGKLLNNNPPYPNFSVWWDADIAREQLDNGRIDKHGTGRILSPYNMKDPALDGAVTWRNAQPLYGDLFGDWREEVLFESTDRSSLIIFTPVTAATNRLVCLAQNPAYRACLTVKGYMQTTWPDYYIGGGMGRPPVQPISDADLRWNGGATAVWDGTAANWLTNNLWVSNSISVAYFDGASVVFGLTDAHHTVISLNGTLTPSHVKVHSPNHYTFEQGEWAGSMTLTKAGAGRMTLDGNHTFTGRTLVNEGLLAVNGELPGSAVVVRGGAWLDGRIGGNGNIGAGVRIEQGGGLSPGQGTNSAATLTISNTLSLTGFTWNDFDLSDDSGGILATNDLVQVLGNVVLQGSNTLVIHRLSGDLGAGVYPLIRYSGSLSGSLANLSIAGLDGVPIALTNSPGEIALVVKSSRPAANVVWLGGPGGVWDLVTSSNWLNSGSRDWFVPLDSVRFDNVGAANPVVNLIASLPVTGVVVDAAASYTFNGNGSISGASALMKTNTGTLVVLTENDYTGRTVIGSGVLEVPSLSVGGAPGALGAANTSATNLLLFNSTLRVTGGEAYTDRGMTLAGGIARLDVPGGSGLVNFVGQIAGPGTLEKIGNGTLILGKANSYAGGTVVNAGTLQLGSPSANTSGLGGGLVTLSNGGVLSLFAAGAEDLGFGGAGGPFVNSILIPAGTSGSLRVPFRIVMNNPLLGSGTLNLGVTGVRGDLNGNWSAFDGTINISTLRETSDARLNNPAGLPNARVHVAAATALQNRVGGTPTIPIGQLSGANGSIMSAGGGNGGLPVTWRVGALNTDATFAGNIYNSVNFIKEGTGTWTWTGTNSHTGSLTINMGTLQVGNGGTRGTLGTGSINNQGTLAWNRSDLVNDASFGVISGSGSLAKRGAGRLVLSKAHTYSGRTVIESGELALAGGAIPNSSRIEISTGAVFDVSGAAGGGMTLSAGKVVTGNGRVRGDFTIGPGAVLAPGSSIGTLGFSNTLTFSAGALAVIEITAAPRSHDVVRVVGTLNLGGALVVTNAGVGEFAPGQQFQLFEAGALAGAFSGISLPPLLEGLAWNTSELNTLGKLSVLAVAPPVVSSFGRRADGTFELQFSGTSGQPYEIRASTNLALFPLTTWTLLHAGVFEGTPVLYNDLDATNAAQRFYLIRIP
ncbi:MAG TPA: autotransporter-associated beta strand repeat-containing protein [Verrucomicrobiae bacterium]|nr:autotransporter-associated beta strand repeat-containing protein [Verrucomicrobiae bacterium]